MTNLQSLRAKYGFGAASVETTAPAAAATPAVKGKGALAFAQSLVGGQTEEKSVTAKAWESTKSAAVKTGNFVADVTPATRGSVKDLAASMNNKFNQVDEKLFEHELYIHMIAQAKGVNLPDEETVKAMYQQYLKDQEEEAKKEKEKVEAEVKTEAETPAVSESIINSVVSAVLSALGKNPEKQKNILTSDEELEEYMTGEKPAAPTKKKFYQPEEETVEETPEKEEEEAKQQVEEQVESKPKQRRFKCATKGCKKKVFEKGDECDTCASAEEEPKKEAPKSGRRKLGRQAPLAE
jgi:hypothetical protein